MLTKTYQVLVEQVLPHIQELFPWDVDDLLQQHDSVLMVDIREPAEFALGSIRAALNVPRGILEAACDWGYAETVPRLVQARQQPVVLVCRSGKRSALAAFTLQQMGYSQVYSLKTGIRGWNDAELPLYKNNTEQVDVDLAEQQLSPVVLPEQLAH